jgi:hypothetical protein
VKFKTDEKTNCRRKKTKENEPPKEKKEKQPKESGTKENRPKKKENRPKEKIAEGKKPRVRITGARDGRRFCH